jgi:hypothetical protein
MFLPQVENAIVEEEKIIGYLLSSSHPDGASKAAYFESLGFRSSEWHFLANALRHLAETQPVKRSLESVHGRKYIIEGPIVGPNGRAGNIRSVWIIDSGTDFPRLVTAYPCK